MTWLGADGLSQAQLKKSWPIVSGEIISSVVSSERDRAPKIQYKYIIQGDTLTGVSNMNLPAFGGKGSRQDAAGKVVKAFPTGTVLQVFYNPDDPKDSYLKISPTWDVFMKLGLGVMLSLFAGFLLGKTVSRFKP